MTDTESNDLGRSVPDGLAGAEAPEPHSRLGPSDGIPSALTTSDPHISQLREMLLTRVGGYESFKRSFSWRTFSPDRRANDALVDAINTLEAGQAELADEGMSGDRQREWLASAVRKWAAYQHAGARTLNWMITGPAKFPVERNKKAMRVEDKRRDEYLAFACHATEWARRRVRSAERKAAIDADAASGVVHKEKVVNGVRVVLNKALDRVQIIFPDKPSDDERAILKREAFRWAPSVGAWQRQLTQNGVWAAERVLSKIAIATEAGTAETVKQGSVHEGAGPKDIAQKEQSK